MTLLLRQEICRSFWSKPSVLSLLTRPSSLSSRINLVPRVTASTTTSKDVESFWDKNKRLQRPISPHLTIYKWEITASMSIAHRTSGLILASGLYAFGIGTIFLSGNLPYYLSSLQLMHLGSVSLFLLKFALSFPFAFHLCSGTRHLLWDMGKGFKISSVYMTGYIAIGTALALSTFLALL